MIDGKNIKRNARARAREESKMMHAELLPAYIQSGKDEAYINAAYQASLRGALRGAHVKFKTGNLDMMVQQSPHFDALASILALGCTETVAPLPSTAVLEFINDCLMVKCCAVCRCPSADSIGDRGLAFVEEVWNAVCNIFYEIVDEFEEFYFSDFHDSTKEKAGKMYRENFHPIKIPCEKIRCAA